MGPQDLVEPRGSLGSSFGPGSSGTHPGHTGFGGAEWTPKDVVGGLGEDRKGLHRDPNVDDDTYPGT